MKVDVLVVEPDLNAFEATDRRLRDRFHLVWASSCNAALTMLSTAAFDAVLVRADDGPSLAFISRLTAEFPTIPIVAIAPWEVQGDRACECGAKEWVSTPINAGRLATVLDLVSVEARQAREGVSPVSLGPTYLPRNHRL
jgi:DNA-binding response OmpR family regulator